MSSLTEAQPATTQPATAQPAHAQPATPQPAQAHAAKLRAAKAHARKIQAGKAQDELTDDEVRQLTERMALVVVTPSWGSPEALSQGNPIPELDDGTEDPAQYEFKDFRDSVESMRIKPRLIVVVDGMADSRTKARVEAEQSVRDKVAAFIKDNDVPPQQAERMLGDCPEWVYVSGDPKKGPAQWLNLGMKEAYRRGAEWFWLLDTYTIVLPDALRLLAKWMPGHDLIQGRYLLDQDWDGSCYTPASFTQFHPATGLTTTIRHPRCGRSGYMVLSAATARGMLVSRRLVDAIGLPDPRFALHGADTMYTYLASFVTNPIGVPDKPIRWNLPAEPSMKEVPDPRIEIWHGDCYVTMRNRGYLARYLQLTGAYRPVPFAFGTTVMFCSQLIHMHRAHYADTTPAVVELIKGWVAARRIMHDSNWRPMKPLKPAKPSF